MKKSWKTFWSIKDVYKMKREVERGFLCFRGFCVEIFVGLKLLWTQRHFSAHLFEGILEKFSKMRYIYWLGRSEASWRGSLQWSLWNDFESLYPVNKIWVGHFPVCVGGCYWWLSVRGFSSAPDMAGFCVLEERELGAQEQVWLMGPDKPHTKSLL